ncbi:MAG: hypothetical protein LBC51_09020 [Treponema sp.]|jgi:hypothetical protein|nr:hypothetical protein [Treponema sp.]
MINTEEARAEEAEGANAQAASQAMNAAQAAQESADQANNILPDKANLIKTPNYKKLSQAVSGDVLGLVTFNAESTPLAPPAAGSITLNDGSYFAVDAIGNMTYTDAGLNTTELYTDGTWQVSEIFTTGTVVTFTDSAGGAWEAGKWVSGSTIIGGDLQSMMALKQNQN